MMNLDARGSLNKEQIRDEIALRNVPRPEAKPTCGASGSTLINLAFSENLKTLASKAVYVDAVDGIADIHT
jgi:hypothetical protein